jgi:toxin-antitoxin system PIN domain toxin
MIAVDTNILVYAHREDSPWHEAALACMESLANSGNPWAIAWPSIHEFLAIVTHPKIYNPPSPLKVALASLEAWQGSPGLRLLAEGPGYFSTLSRVAEGGKVKGPKIHDARIAALCLHHGVKRLWSADRDFSSFPELRTENPLV